MELSSSLLDHQAKTCCQPGHHARRRKGERRRPAVGEHRCGGMLLLCSRARRISWHLHGWFPGCLLFIAADRPRSSTFPDDACANAMQCTTCRNSLLPQLAFDRSIDQGRRPVGRVAVLCCPHLIGWGGHGVVRVHRFTVPSPIASARH